MNLKSKIKIFKNDKLLEDFTKLSNINIEVYISILKIKSDL